MVLSDEIKKAVYDAAYRMFQPREIAVMVGVPIDEFCNDVRIQGSDAHRAYWDGHYQIISEIRERMISAAANGSNPAQEALLKLAMTDNDIDVV